MRTANTVIRYVTCSIVSLAWDRFEHHEHCVVMVHTVRVRTVCSEAMRWVNSGQAA
jgi:hypothetical protein